MKKQGIITFKADSTMLEALERVENKSEFIREAIMAALSENCPLCGGTGKLNARQKKHWTAFVRSHEVEHCDACNGVKLKCRHAGHTDECAENASDGEEVEAKNE